MSTARDLVLRAGDGVDSLAATVRAAPGVIGDTLAVAPLRRLAVFFAVGYVVVYLIAIQDIAFSQAGRLAAGANFPSLEAVPDWPQKVLQTRAPLLFEPVAAIYLFPQLAIFLSPGNLLIGGLLGVLLGLNVATALRRTQVGACGTNRWAGAAGALPALLMGFGCCAPTFLLLLGSNVTAALLPAFVPLRPFLLPLAIAVMTALLLRATRPVGEVASQPQRPRRLGVARSGR